MFAELALFFLNRGSGVDISKEKHGALKMDASIFFNLEVADTAQRQVRAG